MSKEGQILRNSCLGLCLLVLTGFLAACGRGESDSSELGVNWFGGFDPDVQKEFDDALANPRYTVFQSRGTPVEVRIGVVRVGSIERPGLSRATEAVGPSHKAFLDVIAAAEGTS